MFIGHYALGFAAKRVAPRTSLGVLMAAPTLADLLWPVFLLLGWEHVSVTPNADPFLNLTFDSYPVSHSLLALVGWGVLCGALYALRTHYRLGAAVVFLLVVSHWGLDYIVHRLDLPLFPGGPRVGLGLWHSVAGTLVVEGLMFAGGVWLYMSTTAPKDRIGSYGLWTFVGVLLLSYAASLAAGPPPAVRPLAIGAIIFGWLFVAWTAWIDRHRELRGHAGA